VLDSQPASGAPAAGHDLIGDPQELVPITELTHALVIAGRGDEYAGCGTYHRLGDERSEPLRPLALNRHLEIIQARLGAALRRRTSRAPQTVRRRNPRERVQ
jgi:hypothetical protein